jgi:hypothetical protein
MTKVNLTPAAIATMRRKGAGWAEVDEADGLPEGKHRSATFYGQLLADAGYDRKGRKGKQTASKARSYGKPLAPRS